MNSYTINLLKYADWFAPGTTVYDHAYGRHDPVKICLVGFLVRGGGRTLMIDTGMDGIDATYSDADKARWTHLGPSRNTASLLAGFGLTPEDIDTVALTHLHFDHSVNAPLYRRARFYVAEREWRYLHDPVNAPGCPPVGFPRGPLQWLAGQGGRLTLIDDGHEIAPGITMHWTGAGYDPSGVVAGFAAAGAGRKHGRRFQAGLFIATTNANTSFTDQADAFYQIQAKWPTDLTMGKTAKFTCPVAARASPSP